MSVLSPLKQTARTLLKPRAARIPVALETMFVAEPFGALPVTILNLTIYGFMGEAPSRVEEGLTGILAFANGDELKAEVRWTKGRCFGAEFVPALRTFDLARILALPSTGV